MNIRKMYVDNTCVADFLNMYCMGKSFLWNLFFGWVKTVYNADGTIHHSIYAVPYPIYMEAEDLSHKYMEYKVI